MEVWIFMIEMGLIIAGCLIGIGVMLGEFLAERKLCKSYSDSHVSGDNPNCNNCNMGICNGKESGGCHRSKDTEKILKKLEIEHECEGDDGK